MSLWVVSDKWKDEFNSEWTLDISIAWEILMASNCMFRDNYIQVRTDRKKFKHFVIIIFFKKIKKFIIFYWFYFELHRECTYLSRNRRKSQTWSSLVTTSRQNTSQQVLKHFNSIYNCLTRLQRRFPNIFPYTHLVRIFPYM